MHNFESMSSSILKKPVPHEITPPAEEFVSFSARVTAALRALETDRPDSLFKDPLAANLAGHEAFSFLMQRKKKGEDGDRRDRPYVAVRTRFFDEFLMSSLSETRQVVIIGAGMDTRAFRLSWPSGTSVYELDKPNIIARKNSLLKSEEPHLTCERRVIEGDLTQSWSHLLINRGYQADLPSVWLLEGLLMYLSKSEVYNLLETISNMTAPGSWLGADLLNLEAVRDKNTAKVWRSGFDYPEELFAYYGWDVDIVQPGDEGANFGRYTRSLPPREVLGIERVFFVTAKKKKS